MKQVFISDLHLKSLNDPVTDAFLCFLEQEASSADQLYILGDFFEYWIGDDAGDALSDCIAETLHKLHQDKQTDIFFMVGNRDFLVGRDFCDRAGMTLIEEPYKLPGTDILLCHGDAECTSDTDYQQVRQMLRNPQWQQAFLSKPLEERIAFARQARAQSKEHQAGYELTDLDDNAVINLLNSHQATFLIHGHTHQPGIRKVADTDLTRLTLSDWDHDIYYACIINNSPAELIKFIPSS